MTAGSPLVRRGEEMIGLGGTIARHVADGYSVGLCDLTAGELGSNGTPEERRAEAAEAARMLGVAWRENLGWPDGSITPDLAMSAVELIRTHRPRAIAIPYGQDRHPDHVAAHQVLTLAAFRSGLRRVLSGSDAWRPDWVCSYFINDMTTPSFVVDVSAQREQKAKVLACYRSQLVAAGDRAHLMQGLDIAERARVRDAFYGARAGVAAAEAFVVDGPLPIGDPAALFGD